jgi:hypothetical protein
MIDFIAVLARICFLVNSVVFLLNCWHAEFASTSQTLSSIGFVNFSSSFCLLGSMFVFIFAVPVFDVLLTEFRLDRSVLDVLICAGVAQASFFITGVIVLGLYHESPLFGDHRLTQVQSLLWLATILTSLCNLLLTPVAYDKIHTRFR